MLTRKIQEDSMLFYDGDNLILTVEETECDSGILMVLKGEVRSEIAYHIQDELDAFTTIGVKVTIDFKEVTFAAPSFLNSLLKAQKRVDVFQQKALLLRNIPNAIYNEMDEIGMTDLLMIEV